jgi:cell shape-determining protein MreD
MPRWLVVLILLGYVFVGGAVTYVVTALVRGLVLD